MAPLSKGLQRICIVDDLIKAATRRVASRSGDVWL